MRYNCSIIILYIFCKVYFECRLQFRPLLEEVLGADPQLSHFAAPRSIDRGCLFFLNI